MSGTTPAETGLDDTLDLISRSFADALHEGLSRVTPPWSPRGRPLPAPAALLRDHREAILDDLSTTLPTVLEAAGHPDPHALAARLLTATRTRLEAVITPEARHPAPAPVTPELELALTTLLIQSAARHLPDVPPRGEALRTLGRSFPRRSG
ncbi:hypothetical protein [Streptomyces sp. TRM64462]|uniref:hypothetical protein n=1 Tax=Streptomyces sp. TRM64462 TaxID=2741726 RepID=UPI001586ADB2|nr:hypothetical protein [Streptomyces sp. TRM64462]